MIDVYAKTFMIATRTECVSVVDVPRPKTSGGLSLKRFLRRRKCVDLTRL